MLIFRKIINKYMISFTAIKFDKNCYFIERESHSNYYRLMWSWFNSLWNSSKYRKISTSKNEMIDFYWESSLLTSCQLKILSIIIRLTYFNTTSFVIFLAFDIFIFVIGFDHIIIIANIRALNNNLVWRHSESSFSKL